MIDSAGHYVEVLDASGDIILDGSTEDYVGFLHYAYNYCLNLAASHYASGDPVGDLIDYAEDCAAESLRLALA